ncbi:hypothetical protein KC19_VG095600 [Ceratodon purpureus]|uniref:Uncharacterized protein n=1 Tax=Ceratodon purpureus TaxID=3225 RepID=A0A8T0HNK9_CERPU|nr:hypothetical protein KC19_VG095600 [Ceratodon purpureus]
MELSKSMCYESMVCEEVDSDDRWWFLATEVETVTSVDSATVGVDGSDQAMETTEVGDCSDIRSTPVFSGCIGEIESVLVDSIYAKYGGTSQLRSELVNLVMLILSLQIIDPSSATDMGSEECQELFNDKSFATLIASFVILVLSILFFAASCSRGALKSVGEYIRSAFGYKHVEVMRGGGEIGNAGETVESVIKCRMLQMPVSGQDTVVTDLNAEDGESSLENESSGIWSEWYDNMSEEAEHNLECYLPR